jgi:hypothetical protein
VTDETVGRVAVVTGCRSTFLIDALESPTVRICWHKMRALVSAPDSSASCTAVDRTRAASHRFWALDAGRGRALSRAHVCACLTASS